MTLASHYVLEEILNSLRDVKGAGNVLEKFCIRYSDDIELTDICREFRNYLKSKDPKSLENIEKSLKELINSRGREAGGGEILWYKDRRPGRSA